MKEERRLWRAVLVQAYQDAEGIAIEVGTALAPIQCERAQRYLRADSVLEKEDLSLVCDFANVPADRVYAWARRRYPVAA
jgi:hypothetical protein